MSETKSKVYVVMRRSGAVMQLGRMHLGGGADTYCSSGEGPYSAILDAIASEMSTAGGNYDSPHQLFLNGKCVVDGGLADLAWKWHRDRIAAREAADNAVKNLHMPDWLPDDEQKPGYNPPGIDVWTVERAKP